MNVFKFPVEGPLGNGYLEILAENEEEALKLAMSKMQTIVEKMNEKEIEKENLTKKGSV